MERLNRQLKNVLEKYEITLGNVKSPIYRQYGIGDILFIIKLQKNGENRNYKF